MRSEVIHIRIDSNNYKKFIQKAEDMGVTNSELGRDYIIFGLNDTAIVPNWLKLKKVLEDSLREFYEILDNAP